MAYTIYAAGPSTLPLGYELKAEWLKVVSPSTVLVTLSPPKGMSNGRG